jgi:hypothetical protein
LGFPVCGDHLCVTKVRGIGLHHQDQRIVPAIIAVVLS